jgi:hypothetical protein
VAGGGEVKIPSHANRIVIDEMKPWMTAPDWREEGIIGE